MSVSNSHGSNDDLGVVLEIVVLAMAGIAALLWNWGALSLASRAVFSDPVLLILVAFIIGVIVAAIWVLYSSGGGIDIYAEAE
jgi:hypothetical protein